MRFVCDSCRAQYMISDEKVGAKGVKVRCKKCGYVILVRRPQDVASPPPAPTDPGVDATQVMQNPLASAQSAPPPPSDPDVTSPGVPNPVAPSVLAGVDEDEIGAVFDQVLQSGAHKIPAEARNGHGAQENGVAPGDAPDDRMSTRVLDVEVIKKLADQAAVGGAPTNGTHVNGKSEASAGPSAAVDHDWFVAIDDKQVGPLKLGAVKSKWEQGEIGPDSLCWRAGFSDWQPLSEVTELASVLAPKPKQPVIVANPSVEPSLVTVPVESAFTSGGVTRTVRSDVPVLAAAPAAQEDVGWKPSAASALASLVKEEIEALAKPAPAAKKAPVRAPDESRPQVRGILDLPSQEHPIPNDGATLQVPAAAAAPFSAPPGAHPAPAVAPAPFGAAPYTTTFKAPRSSSKALIYGGLAVLVLILVLLIGVVGYLVVKDRNVEPIVQKPAESAQPVVAKNEAPAVPAPRVEEKKTEPAQPATTQPATQPTTQPATQQTTQPATQPATAGADTKAAEPVAPKKEEPKAEAPAVARAEAPKEERRTEREPSTRRERGSSSDSVRETRLARREESKVETPPPAPKEETASAGSGGDVSDDFESVFGGGGAKKKTEASRKEETKSSGRSVYVPPAPGTAEIPKTLGQSDIMSVVLANKPAIVKCVQEQKKQDPNLSGKLVMRWTIKTNGRTSNVSVQSSEFKSTYLATCIGGLIKGWRFPEHQVQGDPIDFPFTF